MLSEVDIPGYARRCGSLELLDAVDFAVRQQKLENQLRSRILRARLFYVLNVNFGRKFHLMAAAEELQAPLDSIGNGRYQAIDDVRYAEDYVYKALGDVRYDAGDYERARQA